MPSFYYPQLNQDCTDVDLSVEESQHVLKARRLRVGDSVSLINGQGLSAHCELVGVAHSVARLKVLTVDFRPRTRPSLSIASALPKGDRMRTLIDMLAQLGVAHFIPLRCTHSVQKSTSSLLSKLQRYALEACKQSDNPWLMQIDSECSVVDLLQRGALPNSPAHLIFYADAGEHALTCMQLGLDDPLGIADFCVAIGPEGGFSQAESTAFAKARVNAVRLSDTILRTETAAVAVAAQWSLLRLEGVS